MEYEKIEKTEKEKACEAFNLKIGSHVDSLCFSFRANPRIIAQMKSLQRSVMGFITEYIMDDKIPEVVVQTKEQIEGSLFNDPMDRKKKVRKRKHAQVVAPVEDKTDEEKEDKLTDVNNDAKDNDNNPEKEFGKGNTAVDSNTPDNGFGESDNNSDDKGSQE